MHACLRLDKCILSRITCLKLLHMWSTSNKNGTNFRKYENNTPINGKDMIQHMVKLFKYSGIDCAQFWSNTFLERVCVQYKLTVSSILYTCTNYFGYGQLFYSNQNHQKYKNIVVHTWRMHIIILVSYHFTKKY